MRRPTTVQKTFSTVEKTFSQEIFEVIKGNDFITTQQLRQLNALKQGELQLSTSNVDKDSLNTLHLLAYFKSDIQELVISKIDPHALATMLQQTSNPRLGGILANISTSLKPTYYVEKAYAIQKEKIGPSSKDKFLEIVTKYSGLLPVFEYLNSMFQKNEGQFGNFSDQYSKDFYAIIAFLNNSLSQGLTAEEFRSYLKGLPSFADNSYEYLDLRNALSSLNDESLAQAIISFKKFIARNLQHPMVQAMGLNAFADPREAQMVAEHKGNTVVKQTSSVDALPTSSTSPKGVTKKKKNNSDANGHKTGDSVEISRTEYKTEEPKKPESPKKWIARPQASPRIDKEDLEGPDTGIKRSFKINQDKLKTARNGMDMTLRLINKDKQDNKDNKDQINEIRCEYTEKGGIIKFFLIQDANIEQIKRELELIALNANFSDRNFEVDKNANTLSLNLSVNGAGAPAEQQTNFFNFMGAIFTRLNGPEKQTLVDGYIEGLVNAQIMFLNMRAFADTAAYQDYNKPDTAATPQTSEDKESKDKQKFTQLQARTSALMTKLDRVKGGLASLKSSMTFAAFGAVSHNDLNELSKVLDKIQAQYSQLQDNVLKLSQRVEKAAFKSAQDNQEIEKFLIDHEAGAIKIETDMTVLQEKHRLLALAQEKFGPAFDKGSSSISSFIEAFNRGLIEARMDNNRERIEKLNQQYLGKSMLTPKPVPSSSVAEASAADSTGASEQKDTQTTEDMSQLKEGSDSLSTATSSTNITNGTESSSTDEDDLLEEVLDDHIDQLADAAGVAPEDVVKQMRNDPTRFKQGSPRPSSKYCKAVSFWAIEKVDNSSNTTDNSPAPTP